MYETNSEATSQNDAPSSVAPHRPAHQPRAQLAPHAAQRAAVAETPETPFTGTTANKVVTAITVGLPLVSCVLAIGLLWTVGWMGWTYLLLLLGTWLLTAMGITIGYHRLLSHHSFEAHPVARAFWVLMGAFAVQGSPLVWCAVHRKHHQFSDTDGDPHSPHLSGSGLWNAVKGYAHAHVGWMFGGAVVHPDINKYVPDLADDPLLRAIDRHYAWVVTASLTIPMVLGGVLTWSLSGALLGLLWGGLVRVCMTHHFTWSVNSACHVFGSRDFDSRDGSTNNLLFGLLTHGEGWHNNHHAFPTSARHGLKWWQFDLSWLVIRLMQRTGLVWNVQTPSAKAMEARRITGRGARQRSSSSSPPATKR